MKSEKPKVKCEKRKVIRKILINEIIQIEIDFGSNYPVIFDGVTNRSITGL